MTLLLGDLCSAAPTPTPAIVEAFFGSLQPDSCICPSCFTPFSFPRCYYLVNLLLSYVYSISVPASCESNSWQIPNSKGGLENVNLCSETKGESTLHGDPGKLDWKDFFYNKVRQSFLQAYQKSGKNTINENKQKKGHEINGMQTLEGCWPWINTWRGWWNFPV